MIDALIFFSFLLAVGRCLGSVLSDSPHDIKRFSSFETLPSASRPQHCPSPPTASFFQSFSSSYSVSMSISGGNFQITIAK